jgi:glycosyltransferase involved in cell wall biosynthesis
VTAAGKDLSTEKFVSVVVPTRNRAEKLRVCLKSLLAQGFPADRYEVVVVDDGSSDSTVETALSVADSAHGVRFVVVTQTARGAGAARNVGLTVATGDPVCFVDDDTDVPPGWLSAMVRGFEQYPEADAYAGRVRARVEKRGWQACPQHPLASSLDVGAADRKLLSAVGANMAVRRSAIEKVGGFDDWVVGADDTEWFDRLYDAAGTVMYIGEAGVWHRRDAAEVRFFRLVRSEFRRGVASHTYFLRIGRRDPRPARRAALSLLRMAPRHRCRGLVAGAARQAGFAYGLRRHRHDVPPPPHIWEATRDEEWTVVSRR